ncbi:MAG TPA: hypothetical protein PLO38_06295 [Verrucomicrobiota bacterium]|nr:hypothetical protein [Verrucomicrobiota bacterium]
MQPIAPIEPRHHRRIQQPGLIHVVQNQQAARRIPARGKLLQLAANPLKQPVGALLFVLGELKSHCRSQFGQRQAQILPARAAHQPAPPAVFLGVGVRIFGGQRGLAQAPHAVDGRQHANPARLHKVLPQLPQRPPATHEVRIVRLHVAGASRRAFAVLDGVPYPVAEFGHAFLHGRFEQRRCALVIPQAQVEVLAPSQLVRPRLVLLLITLLLPARHFYQVNRHNTM